MQYFVRFISQITQSQALRCVHADEDKNVCWNAEQTRERRITPKRASAKLLVTTTSRPRLGAVELSKTHTGRFLVWMFVHSRNIWNSCYYNETMHLKYRRIQGIQDRTNISNKELCFIIIMNIPFRLSVRESGRMG